MATAVAIDLGATSGRYALGSLVDGKITFEVIEQIPHQAIERNGRVEWNLETLLGLCRRALAFAASNGASTLAIDAWGVDHGFLDSSGNLIGAPICYRDRSHADAFASLEPHRHRLYELTGIQHQPFNTICQLVARREEDPSLPSRASFYILPDLLGYLLGGQLSHELTEASTTQLMGLEGKWSEEAFAIAGWPVPTQQPTMPGKLAGSIGRGVQLANVGSHDTASAVVGFGTLASDQLFVNVGTWSLAGSVIDRPIASREAEAGNFTNEWTSDGRIRLLKNIPGFYVINRLHEELKVSQTVPQWLRSAEVASKERIDLLHGSFFNPESMIEACLAQTNFRPSNEAQWAGLALASLTNTVAKMPSEISALSGQKFREFRVGGGGSQSEEFCQSLANESGLPVVAGPAEATVLGNLATQFLASGEFANWQEAYSAIDESTETRTYRPN